METTKKRAAAVPAAMANAFEGASRSGRISHWDPFDGGPNTDIAESMPLLRARQRQQTRDNAIALSAREQWVINVIGTGLRPHLELPDVALRDEIMALWNQSVDEMDADGQCDFYGQQAVLAHTVFDSGSCLARRRYRRIEDGLAVPLQVQLMEPDHLDEMRDGEPRPGVKIKLGIQMFNGKREGYWLRRAHPGDGLSTGAFQSSFVPADDIAHVFRQRRPGQLTGVPHLHAAMILLYEMDKYLDAEMVRKQQAAMNVGAVTNTTGNATPENIWGDDAEKAWGLRSEFYSNMGALRSGTWNVLAPGDSITFNDPQDVGPNFDMFVANYHRLIAASAGITYEQLTGKMTDVNYSSARVRLIDIRRGFEMDQRNVVVYQYCRRVWGWWLDTAVAVGRLRIPNYMAERHKYRPRWVAQPFEHIDLLKELAADVGAVRAGFKSHEEMVMEWGGDPAKLYPLIAQINAMFDDMGIVLDTDPRHVNGSGAMQTQKVVADDAKGDTNG